MFYYLYEIINNLNGKIYIGVHETRDLNDGYMGSGKIILRAIAKHGVENFTKIILETFENAESMYEREKEIVTEEFLLREDTYNLRRGGRGGFDYINKQGLGLRTGVILTPEMKTKMGHVLSVFERTQISLRLIGNTFNPLFRNHGLNHPASGPKSEEHKRKISQTLIGRTKEKSPNFGLVRKQVKCPYCDKKGSYNVMKRWHFENCKTRV